MSTLFIDYDDTLHDSASKFAQRLEGIIYDGQNFWQVYLKIHREIIHKKFLEKHDNFMFHVKLFFKYINQPYNNLIAKQILRNFLKAKDDCWKNPSFFPDAIEFLNKVKENGYKLCLTTVYDAKKKVRALEIIGGRKYFEFAFGEEKFRKSEKDYYIKSLELSSSVPDETIIIGDTLTSDILPAKKVGIKTILINRKDEKIPKGSIEPDHEVRNLLEALKYL